MLGKSVLSETCRRIFAVAIACACATVIFGREAHAQGEPSYQHVENMTQTFRAVRDFSAIAASDTDPDTVYIGTSDGWIYASRDGGKSWAETRLAYSYARLPTRAPHRHYQSLWSNYVGWLPYADMIEWPQVHGVVNMFRVHYLWLPSGFRLERLNPSPYIAGGGPMQMSAFGERRPSITPELHYHGVVSGTGAPNMGLVVPHRLKSSLEPSFRESVLINWLAVHPEDPSYVLAATDDGVYRSEDGGAGWVREYDHLEEANRLIRHISFDPNTPSTRYACTDFGLLVSPDGGVTYSRVRDAIIAQKKCFFVTGRRGRPGEIWVGTDRGTYMSKDGGDTFEQIHIEQAPGRQFIKRIVFHPNEERHLITMADEVIFVSEDNGRTFDRKGTTTFKAQTINSVEFGPGDGHLIVATNRDIYESFDDGETWQVILFGNLRWTIRRMFFPAGVASDLWVLTSYELMRLSEREPWELSESQLRQLRADTSNEPTMSETIYEALRSHGVLRPDLDKRRAKSRWSHMLPFVHAEASYRAFNVNFDQFSIVFGRADADGQFPRGLQVEGPYKDLHWQAYATWDLQSLVFDREELPAGPAFQENEALARSLRDSITSIYAERRRLQIQAAARAQSDLRAIVLRDLRIEELTHQLNLLTDDLFERYRTGEKIEAWSDTNGG